MENQHEMNFIDLCVECGRAIGKGCKALGRLLAHMTRLTCRYWWVVLTLVALSIAAALYYTRPENKTYKLNAIALLNGPSIQQFEQTYAPLCSNQRLPQDAAITKWIADRKVTHFTTFRVVDCLNDEVADLVDFKHKFAPTDTVNVLMNDRLCLQFRVKERNMAYVQEIEQALLEYLNSNPAMQQTYESYMVNLRDEVAFNHRQTAKLDSLTSAYYYNAGAPVQKTPNNATGVNFYGDRKIRLFLDEIYKQQAHTQRGDYRLQLATAPVVLENHFSADPKPVNGRFKCLLILVLLGWISGCIIAELIDKRKAISAWLKQ